MGASFTGFGIRIIEKGKGEGEGEGRRAEVGAYYTVK
jgi:hypothetical protein